MQYIDSLPLPIRQTRLILAVMLGLFAFGLCLIELERRDELAADFTWIWRGSQDLLAGNDPYNTPEIGRGSEFDYPFDAPLFYPLHALLVGIPFSWMPVQFAGALFFGLSSGALAYVITQDGYTRLPLFLSASFFMSAQSAQWGPFIMAIAFVPWLAGFLIAKPNLGIAVLAAYPTRIAAFSVLIVTLVTLAIMPTWPMEWWRNLSDSNHHPPILIYPVVSFLMVLTVGAYRLTSGRLLAVVSFVPHYMWWYDPLILWLIPRTLRQSIFLTGMSWIGYAGWALESGSASERTLAVFPYLFLGVYLPALMLVLWQMMSSWAPVQRWLALCVYAMRRFRKPEADPQYDLSSLLTERNRSDQP